MAQVYKGTGTRIAKMVGNSAVMDTAAESIRAKATALAGQHRDTGAYSGNFKVARHRSPAGRGVVDRVVYNDHPAACAIEFGHFAVGADGTPGKWVPGQFNLTRAVMG